MRADLKDQLSDDAQENIVTSLVEALMTIPVLTLYIFGVSVNSRSSNYFPDDFQRNN